MKILILGIDGYLGWPLAQYLIARGHTVGGCDSGVRRKCVMEVGGKSIVPIEDYNKRSKVFDFPFFLGIHLLNKSSVDNLFDAFRPDAVVHLGQCPSAPYSMKSARNAFWVQENNVLGTLNVLAAMGRYTPDAHLVKLGSMGEYGTPNLDIPEGSFEVEYKGRKDTLPFPRQANSWYHLSKVHDSNNIEFACRNWGLSCTDIMQGIVYGTWMTREPHLATRFDVDEYFGTVINRFVAQAIIGEPLTIYGNGRQERSFLPLNESMECLALALENPAGAGEYRVFNQFGTTHSIYDLALKVDAVADQFEIDVQLNFLDNPRREVAHHHYNPENEGLKFLGYEPATVLSPLIAKMFSDLIPFKDRIKAVQNVMKPTTQWRRT